MVHRLPQPGQDDGQWGDILNDFLSQSHTATGALTNAAVLAAGAGTYSKPADGIPESDLDAATQLKLAQNASGYVKPVGGIPATDLTSAVQTSLGRADSALQAAPVSSVNTKTGAVTLTKSDIGLSSVDNTADTAKPISIAVQSALATKVDTSSLATVATSGSYVDLTNKPTIPSVSDATTTTKGIVQLAGDLGGTSTNPTVPGLTGKEPTIAPGTTGQYFRGDKTFQTLDKSAVGLGNIDNTSDSNKPISAATQAALNAKATAASLAAVATSGSYTDLTNKPTIPTVTGTNSGDQTISLTGTTLTISGSNGNSIVLPANNGVQALTPTSAKTSSYTAALGELVVMNVSGGGTIVTLPSAPTDKAQIGVLAVGATNSTPLTVNRGGSTDTIGPSGATTVSLPLANELTIYQYDAGNTRWIAISNVKPMSQLDARYLSANGVTISGAPSSANQVLTASSTTAASWVTPSTSSASDPVMAGPNVFNVRSLAYGATGDGTTNDVTAIRAAYTAASNYVSSNAGALATVYFPPGTYRVNVTSGGAAISGVARISLVGAGRNRTRINVYSVDGSGNPTSGFLQAFYQAGAGSTKTNPLTDCTFAEMTIDMLNVDPAKTATYTPGGKAFAGQWCKNLTFQNLTITNTPSTALGIDYDLGGCIYTGNRIINCGRSPSNGSSGIGIGTGGNAIEPSIVTSNYVEGSSNHGIFVEKQGSAGTTPYFSWGVIISNNVCIGNRAGISDSGAGGALITGNQIINSTQYGIQVLSGNASSPSPDGSPMATIISNNYITGCVITGVRLDSGYDVTVKDNRIVGFNPLTGAITTTYGIFHTVANGGSATRVAPKILNNDIELCAGTGIYTYVAGGSKNYLGLFIENNRIRANGRAQDGTNLYGVRLRHTSTGEVFRNNSVWDDLPAQPLLATAITPGDTTITCVYDYQQGLPPTGQYVFDSETVTVSAVSTITNMDTAGTFVMTLSSAAASSHTSGTKGAQVSATQTIGISVASGSFLTDVVMTGNMSRTSTGVTAWQLDSAAPQGNNLVQDNYGLSKVLTITTTVAPAINVDLTTQFDITALTVNITSMTTNLSGSPKDGQRLLIRITDNGTARTITWGTAFTSSGIATLLATTVPNKTHAVGLIYDATKAVWVCVAVDATGY